MNTYERAMVSMHKMPRMWIDFLQLLVDLRWVTRTRRAFDRALCALPITQHDRIWQMYLVSASPSLTPSATSQSPSMITSFSASLLFSNWTVYDCVNFHFFLFSILKWSGGSQLAIQGCTRHTLPSMSLLYQASVVEKC